MKNSRLAELVEKLIEFLEVPEVAMIVDDDFHSITTYCYNEEKLGDMIRELKMSVEEMKGNDELKTSIHKAQTEVSDDKS